MARSSTARRLEPLPVEAPSRQPSFGGGEPPPVRPNVTLGSNAWLGVVMFIGAEVMFFAGLIGAFLVFRLSSAVWPPPFQPRLPVGVTGANTAILIASAITMHLALRATRAGATLRSIRWLAVTAGLGIIFLLVQGYEWTRLLHFGLTLSSSVYGGLFYTLIGCHAVHVAGALVWLVVAWVKAARGRFTRQQHIGLQTCCLYWTFVVALWPALYLLVYLY